MKKDLDGLMIKAKVNAICAIGSSSDPVMYYLLNGINVSGIYIKKRSQPAWLVHNSIEREEAKKTGLKLINMNRWDTRKIYSKYEDRLVANAVFIKTIFDYFGIRGKVAFYGKMDTGAGYNMLRQVLRRNDKIDIFYEKDKSLVALATETKDVNEIERIKKIRNGVIKAFDETIKTVAGLKVVNGIIYREKKLKLRIKDLKDSIRNKLFEKGFINSSGMIVAQGRDAGVPHNSGRDNEAVRTGSTIVFDIFPQEIGGGYFFDFTRTVCFGYAAQKVKEEFRTVREAQDIAFENIALGKKTRDIETKVCKLFEKAGHPTFLSKPNTQTGYCHSLGHGIGLNIHERPSFGTAKTNRDVVDKGMIFTVEPGLYYPEKGYGIRLEDVLYIDRRGKTINMTKYPRNLIVEM